MHSPLTNILRGVATALRMTGLAMALLGAAGVAAQQASTEPITTPVTVDLSALPALGMPWLEDNPYRGNAKVAEIGRTLFNQACARCHGDDGNATHHVGTDLRRLDSYCFGKLKDEAARRHCVRDNDHYFKESVLHGKIRVGVAHMPPWEGVLTQEAIWSLRSFLESRRP
ncbi:c-type cytochrome [Methylibium sp.]|uniref:c-type cytochrome n=1 Tax=Methylibium sp. TaxID=2067992 RepID=UPI000AA57F1D